MIISLYRQTKTINSTIGSLHCGDLSMVTLEDPIQKVKVYGNTCIPAGQYVIKLRTEGGKDALYRQRFPDMHKGMLWLQDVPNFQYVYIHIGNDANDTLGCILVGTTQGKDFIGESENAYRHLYPVVADAILSGEDVLIDITNPGGMIVEHWFLAIINFIAGPSIARAIVFALLGAIMFTQWVKFQLPYWLSDASHARRVRSISTLFGAVLCALMWPDTEKVLVGIAVSMVTGLASPTVYWLLIKVVYHFWPWTEDIVSARPTEDKLP